MKRLSILFAVAIFSLGTSFAHAGGYGGHYGGYYGGHYGGHYSSHYSRHHGYRGHRGYRSSRRAADYLIGGLVLGGILHYVFSHPHRRASHGYRHRSYDRYNHRSSYSTPRSHRVYREVVSNPPYKTYSSRSVTSQQSHLHRDRYGNCYRVSYGSRGEELRAERPRAVCNW